MSLGLILFATFLFIFAPAILLINYISKYRISYLISFTLFFTILNFFRLMRFLFLWLFDYSLQKPPGADVLTFYYMLSTPLAYLGMYFLIKWLHQMAETRLDITSKVVFIISFVLVIIVSIYGVRGMLETGNGSIYNPLVRISVGIYLVWLLTGALMMLRKSAELDDEINKRIFIYIGLYCLTKPLYFFLITVHILHYVPFTVIFAIHQAAWNFPLFLLVIYHINHNKLRRVEKREPIEVLREEYDLTKRELELSRMVATGLTNKEIADKIFLSPRTVEKHLNNVYKKTGFKNKVELVNFLMEDSDN